MMHFKNTTYVLILLLLNSLSGKFLVIYNYVATACTKHIVTFYALHTHSALATVFLSPMPQVEGCLGESVTITCTITGVGVRWEIGGFGIYTLTARSTPTPVPGFGLLKVINSSVDDMGRVTSITSTAIANATASLSGTTITCVNIIENESQNTTLVFVGEL